jgi:hypothetical protein
VQRKGAKPLLTKTVQMLELWALGNGSHQKAAKQERY